MTSNCGCHWEGLYRVLCAEGEDLALGADRTPTVLWGHVADWRAYLDNVRLWVEHLEAAEGQGEAGR